MRKIIALLLALLPAAALAQSAPAKLPAQTVYGRLGIPGDTGPGQAIPLKTLAVQLGALSSSGTATLTPNPLDSPGSGPANQIAQTGFGIPINILSTTTGGLGEVETQAALTGWPVHISQLGITSTGTNPQYIGTSTTWQWHPRGIWSIDIDDATINCTMIDATPCIQVDSAEIGRFRMYGQVVKNDAGTTITIKPTTQTPNDHFVVFALNDFSVTTLVGSASGEALLKLDATTAPGLGIQQNVFNIKELNGGVTGIKVMNPAAISGGQKPIFNHNILTATAIHGQATAGIQVGQSTTRQTQMDGNIWTALFSSSSQVDGVVTYESHSMFTVGANDQNTMTNCLHWKSGATNNVAILLDVAGCTTPALDDNIPGGGNIVIGNGNITVGGFNIALQNSNVTFANLSTTTGLFILGSTGSLELTAPTGSALGTSVFKFPIGSTDLSATGGAGKFLKQASAGAALTVVQPAVADLTGFGTGVATALAVNIGTAGSFVVNGGAGGTPSSITLTSGTGLPISTGLTGAGTGVLAALAINVGSAGSFVTNGGAATHTTVSVTGSSAPTNGLYLPAANTPGIAANGNPALEVTNPASAVNFTMMSGAATAGSPYLLASGSDTDVSFFFVTKGAGSMNFSGNGAVTGANAFARFSAASSAAQNGIWVFGANAGSGPRIIALDLSGTGNTNVDMSLESSGTGLIKFGTASAFSANGSVATVLGSLGPTGSHATVQEFLTVKNSSGVIRYIPAF